MKQILSFVAKKLRSLRHKSKYVVVVLGLVLSLGLSVAQASAATFTSGAKVSFTFDDGMASSILAAQTMAPYGYTGTQYVITGCVGMSTTPNACASGPDYSYLTWEQIAELHTTYGWEIGSHTVNHPHMPEISAAQMTQEFVQSKADLLAHGYNATSFAFPYGEYNNTALAEGAKVYESLRRFQDDGNNIYPYNDTTIMIRGVQAGIPVSTVKQYVDQAIANNYWLVLVFHEIKTNASTNPDDYEYTPGELAEIAAYIQSKSLPVVNMNDGIVRSGTNLLPNGSFNNGIADGWTTDDPTNIVADSGNHGSYPDPSKSISITAGTGTTGNTHLFSPNVAVNPADTYVVKNFMNVTAINSGSIGYFIDEYDATGLWISGQSKSVFMPTDTELARTASFTYKPTSAAVATARLEVVVARGSGIHAYLDNVQWFPESAIGGSVTPPAQKQGDVNGDNAVDALDLSIVLSNWNKSGQTRGQGDLTGDGVVDALDLSMVLSKWGS
jgi:peptidoglycan/xylan/chitin deacetylase (PgdA/CDA1 family)